MPPFAFLALMAPGLALAENPEPGVSSAAFFQAMAGLALIIALLLLFAFLGRRLLGGKGFGEGGLKLLGGVALGPKERIILLEAGDQWLVIGIVPGQIRTLHAMPKGELPPGHPVTPLPFSHWMQRFTEKRQHEQ